MKWKDVCAVFKKIWLLLARESIRQSGLQACLNGKFERKVVNEERQETSTLEFHLESELSGLYKVIRRTVKECGTWEFSTVERKKEEWLAVYNTATRVLLDTEADRHCFFIPEDLTVVLSGEKYQMKSVVPRKVRLSKLRVV